MISVVLAGGSGTRLWPLSRYAYPKQFIKLSTKSFLGMTLERVCYVKPEKIITVTNELYRFFVQEELEKIPCESQLIYEPEPKNTAPAIALGLHHLLKEGFDSNQVVAVFPSDHMVNPTDVFATDLQKAIALARKGYIVTFGVPPAYPETGYGYIEAGERIDENGFEVRAFREKPDRETAMKYVESGNYLWNSGMFIFQMKTMLNEFKQLQPEIYEAIVSDKMDFESLPEISIDYAIMEKTGKAAVVRASFSWSDVGSWRSFYEIVPDRDEQDNVKIGDVVSIDSRNSLIISQGRLVVTIGLEDCVVVETPDAVLVTRKDQAEKVKDVVGILKEAGKKEAIEHRTTYRPWGSYTVLEEGDRYKIKRITIKPGASLSLQMHYHRSEHWVVVKGTARVVLDDKSTIIHEDESVYVPKSRKHRLENPGKIPVEIIEVQTGEYLGEDDIVRFKDIYGRQDE